MYCKCNEMLLEFVFLEMYTLSLFYIVFICIVLVSIFSFPLDSL